MKEPVYIRFGKKFRKIGRNEVIKKGAMHSILDGELNPLYSPNTVGQKPSDFSEDRNFYNPIEEDKEEVKIDVVGCSFTIEDEFLFYVRPNTTEGRKDLITIWKDAQEKGAKDLKAGGKRIFVDSSRSGFSVEIKAENLTSIVIN